MYNKAQLFPVVWGERYSWFVETYFRNGWWARSGLRMGGGGGIGVEAGSFASIQENHPCCGGRGCRGGLKWENSTFVYGANAGQCH
jgi:hypothetical protein